VLPRRALEALFQRVDLRRSLLLLSQHGSRPWPPASRICGRA
jgi:hypothetical protein